MKCVQVVVPRPFDKFFDYFYDDSLGSIEIGHFVRVPFGSGSAIGIVVSKNEPSLDASKIKSIESVFHDFPKLKNSYLNFIKWISSYTMAPIGEVVRAALPPKDVFLNKKTRKKFVFETPLLHDELKLSDQQKASSQALSQEKNFSVNILDGVTGSGKTEVYFDFIDQLIKREKACQILVLLPEIALSSQWLERFKNRFGVAPGVWHSHVGAAEKRETWKAVIQGNVNVVVGARSSLFLPFNNLKAIIVDEEHEHSFKQEDGGLLYHARDMAVVRAREENIPIVLASATPSVESYTNYKEGKYTLLHLPSRHKEAQLPDVKIINLEEEKLASQTWISTPLKAALKLNIEAGDQSLLFLNRRGYAPLILCRTCGYRFECPSCSAWLVAHSHKNKMSLQCHHCGHKGWLPEACPSCEEEDSFAACGPGVERLAEEVSSLFPDARLGFMTSDHIKTTDDLGVLIEKIEAREIDIIIGTQMVAKGHHFPHLTLVGVVDADLGLMGGDFRAGEKTYQMLHQVAGRAGREEKSGEVYIQTHQANHPVMQALKNWDRDAFMESERDIRRQGLLPPFGRMAALILSSTNEGFLDQYCHALSRAVPREDGLKVLGPAPAPMRLLRQHHRRRFLVMGPREKLLQPFLRNWIAKIGCPSRIKMKIDIDPYGFM